jgi:CubicO group peptidase (beta-lactamase class C family)
MTDAGNTAISDFLAARVAGGDVPAVVAAVAGPGALRYVGAFGKRDVYRNINATPDTIFRLASMTKPITSLAVMMLYDEGRIALDDPVTRHLPAYRQPPVLTRFDAAGTAYESRPASRPITIRDLLTHTSGIAYPFLDPTLARLSAIAKADAELPLLHDPGEKWTYGPSTAILGRVVAHVSGETLDAFCQTRIFDPLGMRDTGYAVPARERDRVTTQHRRDATGEFVEQPNPVTIQSKGRGDDGLFSTAHDYAAFLQLFLNGGRHRTRRLVSEQTIRLLAENQIGDLVLDQQVPTDPSVARPFPPGAGKDKFGFGFQIETAPSEIGMRTPGSLSWSGVFNTNFWIDPQKEIAAVLLLQLLPVNDEKAVSLLRGFERLVYAWLT